MYTYTGQEEDEAISSPDIGKEERPINKQSNSADDSTIPMACEIPTTPRRGDLNSELNGVRNHLVEETVGIDQGPCAQAVTGEDVKAHTVHNSPTREFNAELNGAENNLAKGGSVDINQGSYFLAYAPYVGN